MKEPRPPISGKLGALLQVSAALAVTALLLAGIELVAGLFVVARHPGPADQVEGDAVRETLAWLELNPAPLVKNVDLLWSNQPSVKRTEPVNPRHFGRDDQWTIENNSEGFRGPERDHAVAGDPVYRILCIGDSVTFGFNADQKDVYPRQLEALLHERFPTLRFEVINAGTPGWSWLQGLRFLETRGLALRPDLVIAAHGTNDQLLRARMTDEERFRRLESPLVRAAHSTLLLLADTNSYRVIEQLRAGSREPSEVSPGCEAQMRRTGKRWCFRVSLDEIDAAVREFGRVTAREGVDLLVLNLDFMETHAVRGSRSAAEHDHIPFADLVQEMTALRQADEDARADRLGLSRARAIPADGNESSPRKLVLRVLTPIGGQTYWAKGNAEYGVDFSFEERMYDDGTHGDERAGDRVFTATVDIPRSLGFISYVYYQDVIPEFTPLPPLVSALGNRPLHVPTDEIGPVHVFGESLFMAERTHPDAEGHRVIAREAAAKLQEFPAFQQFLHAQPPARRGPVVARTP